mgnify:CR=1 FL=1
MDVVKKHHAKIRNLNKKIIHQLQKQAIQRIVKESNIFIHNDVANVNRVAESNARYIKDFEIVEENV